jgi:tape measure domain-containing protein
MAGIELATAYVQIQPSFRNLNRELTRGFGGAGNAGARAGQQAGDSFTQNVGSRVQAGSKRMFLPLLAGGALIAGVGAAGLKMGLSVAAGNEQAQISFTTMLGSAEKAGSFIKDLQAFAAATPFEFAGLQQSAASLISAGINADKVIPIMRTLGDVTSGMGTGAEGVQRATIALQQMNAAGKITGEDLNQLRDAGIPVYDLLAKATGKSKSEVVALAQAGKLGKTELDQMMKALESGAGLERFSGLMDKQSKSLTGLWSTFKDTLGQGLANVITPLIPMIKNGLGGASNFLATALPKVGTALKFVVSGLIATFGFLKRNVPPIFNAVKGVVQDVVQWLMAHVPPVFRAVKGAIEAVVSWVIRNWPGIQSAFLTAWNAIKPTLMAWVGLLRTLWTQVLQPIVGWVVSHWPQIQAVMKVVFIAIAIAAKIMLVALQVVFKAVTVAIEILAPVIRWLLNNVVAPVFKAIGTTIGLAVGVIGKVRDAFGAMGRAGSAMWNGVLKPAFTAIVEAFLTVAGAIVHGAATAFGWVPGIGGKLKGAAEKFDTFRDSVKRSLEGIPTSVGITATVKLEGLNAAQQQLAQFVGETRNLQLGAVVPGRATGGPVRAGQPYIVGEKRPELFVPSQNGTILPRVPAGQGGAAMPPIYVQNPFTGEYLLARMGGLVDENNDGLAELNRYNGG